jgi:uncharacterized protein YukE
MKFAMGADTLGQLGKKTSTSTDELGALVRQLAAAGEPLEGKFNGAGRAAFDRFKANADGIATELNSALAAVLGGVTGMDRSFQQGDQELADQTRQTEAGQSFDAARFSGTR